MLWICKSYYNLMLQKLKYLTPLSHLFLFKGMNFHTAELGRQYFFFFFPLIKVRLLGPYLENLRIKSVFGSLIIPIIGFVSYSIWKRVVHRLYNLIQSCVILNKTKPHLKPTKKPTNKTVQVCLFSVICIAVKKCFTSLGAGVDALKK